MELTGEPDVNALLDEAHIPFLLKAASISLGAAGLLVALVGVQNVTLIQWAGLWQVAPWGLVALGALGIFVAAKLVRGRAWTLPGAVAASIVLVLAGVGFLGLAVSSGLFASLHVMAACAAVTALVFSVLAITPFRKLLAVRRKLRSAGFDLDL
jgi:hypothetical protein